MATATHPLYSNAARGSIARTLTYRTTNGRNVVSQHPHASRSHTAAQLAIRARTKIVAQTWATLTPDDKASWKQLAARTRDVPFNAFFRTNWQRLLNNEPIIRTPTPESTTGIRTFAARTFAAQTFTPLKRA
jgi:hypothetical protein